MKSVLKKIFSFISTPATEFNIVRFRCNDRIESGYSLKGSFFGIPICLTISEKSMKHIIDFYNNKKAQDSNTETYYNF